MKNIIKKSMFPLFLLSLTISVMTGCSSAPAVFEEKSYSVAASEIDTLSLDAENRKIEILPSEDQMIHIDYKESEKEYYQVNTSDDKELSIKYAEKKSWSDYIGAKTSGENRKIVLRIPDGTLTDLNISTSNEDLVLPELSVKGGVTISINNGNIQLDNWALARRLS